jgi:methylglutaconyl-CoA hydratase
MISYTTENGIGILTLNRPEKRNALNPQMIQLIVQKLDEIKQDDSTGVLILTGAGKSFCAGADLSILKELQNYSIKENEKDSENLAKMFLAFYNFPMPVIAAVTGSAIAGGCGLASVCDFVIANPSESTFGYSEVKIGFVPAIVSVFLIRKTGFGKAKKLLLTGDIIDGKTAFDFGLVDYLAENPLEEAKILAVRLLKNPKYSVETTKKMIHSISDMNLEAALDYCINLNTISRTSEDFINGINNFFNNERH